MKFSILSAFVVATKAETLFETPGDQCPDPLANEWDRMESYPTGCQIYTNSSPCNQFEMSLDQKVLSCEIPEVCIEMIAEPNCV